MTDAGASTSPPDRCDVLVVGAGPTGLTLAAQLHAYGASVRIVDAALDRVHESRALGVQPRTLEVLRGLGLADELVARGNPTVQLRIHAGRRVVEAPLFDIGLADTAYPFLLFVSQAETEALLGEHLAARGARIERGVRYTGSRPAGEGLTCTLRHGDGAEETVRARYVVGCDGAHSTVRQEAGIAFEGAAYPQTFLLADLDVEGLQPDAVHAYVTDRGPLLFFPLGSPAPWRVITMRGDAATGEGEVSLAELHAITDEASEGDLRLAEPVWATAFKLHHRAAAAYRSGRFLLAGDAAHVHSPVGAQGMNTGIQDAWNLGWKLALVCRGVAGDWLLDSYDAERRPVGRFVLRFTDRAFTVVTSAHPALRLARRAVAPRVIPYALRFRAGRAIAFRTVSQLGIRYRHSPAVDSAGSIRRAPRAGDRLPDARVTRAGEAVWLQEALAAPGLHLLLCGEPGAWEAAAVDDLRDRHEALPLTVTTLHRLPGGGLSDPDGTALARLRVRGPAALLVRPDGHIAVRTDATDLAPVHRYLNGLAAPTS